MCGFVITHEILDTTVSRSTENLPSSTQLKGIRVLLLGPSWAVTLELPTPFPSSVVAHFHFSTTTTTDRPLPSSACTTSIMPPRRSKRAKYDDDQHDAEQQPSPINGLPTLEIVKDPLAAATLEDELHEAAEGVLDEDNAAALDAGEEAAAAAMEG
jgi:hypothetical protein